MIVVLVLALVLVLVMELRWRWSIYARYSSLIDLFEVHAPFFLGLHAKQVRRIHLTLPLHEVLEYGKVHAGSQACINSMKESPLSDRYIHKYINTCIHVYNIPYNRSGPPKSKHNKKTKKRKPCSLIIEILKYLRHAKRNAKCDRIEQMSMIH